MAPTPSQIREIFDTDLSDSAIQTWIEIGQRWIDEIGRKDASLSQSELDNIHKLITAHLASAQDQRLSSASRETASADYQGQTGMNWESTTYGQRALALDPTGTLQDSSKPKASVSVPDSKGLE